MPTTSTPSQRTLICGASGFFGRNLEQSLSVAGIDVVSNCIGTVDRMGLGQMALIAGYSLVIAFCLPEYLTPSFGPPSKNPPILALLFILLSEETAS
jgi:hypothetical protein